MNISSTTCAVITGGASGIGLAIAHALLQRDAHVVLLDVSADVSEVAEGLRREYGDRIVAHRCDVTDAEQLCSVVSQIDHFDVFINNAGIGERTPFTSADATDMPRDWRRCIDINLTAVINGTRLAVNAFKRRGKSGVIINVASLGGLYPMQFAPIYSATKAAVIQFSRSLRSLQRSDNIRVVALCPAYADTALVSSGKSANTTFKDAVDKSGSLLSVQQVANVCILIIQDKTLYGDAIAVTTQFGMTKHDFVPFMIDKNPLIQQIISKL